MSTHFCPLGLGDMDSECKIEQCAPAMMLVAEGEAPVCPLALVASSIASMTVMLDSVMPALGQPSAQQKAVTLNPLEKKLQELGVTKPNG